MRTTLFRRRQLGVSLIEAMVALAVMAFGMLSLVGVQATMRLNNDLAKQRSEATWIATEEVEGLRNYRSLAAVNGQPGKSWAEIASRTLDAYVPPDSIGNTTYRVERTVNTIAATRQKVIKVDVSWADRTGVTQHVVLDSVVTGVAPNLSGLLAVPTRPSATNQVNGRDVTIPRDAVVDAQHPERSLFVPPGSSSVYWYFNNLTGQLRVCASAGDDSGCDIARLVSGTVRYHLSAAAFTSSDFENPQGPAFRLADGPSALTLDFPNPLQMPGVTSRCYADSPASLNVTAINYYCAVTSPLIPGGWGGKLNLNLVQDGDPPSLPLDKDDVDKYQVCRYTVATGAGDAAADATDYTVNVEHPKTYCFVRSNTLTQDRFCRSSRVTNNLINQNFLVIRGGRECPIGHPVDLANGILMNTRTRPHQP